MKIILLILGCFLVLLVLYYYFRARITRSTQDDEVSEKITILTDQNFESQIVHGYTLVEFGAPWCMPCKLLGSVMNELAEDVEIDAKIGKLNVDENVETANKYNVRGIPTSILFKNGEEYKRFVGVKSKLFFVRQLDNAKSFFSPFFTRLSH